MGNTYDSILSVARRLFLERGYSATSMREIAAESGIAKATIYHHFSDKEGILLALLETTLESQKAMLAIVQAETEPRSRIEAAVRENLRLMAEIAGIIQIASRDLPRGREIVKENYAPAMGELRSLLAEAFSRGIVQGLFRSIEPEKATIVLMAMIQGSVAAAMLGDGRIDAPDARAEAILDLFFNGVKA
jgi:AcrR family transcriptional regulator